MDYEVEHCTRHCAASGRELHEAEEFFSVLVNEKREVRRHDYAVEAWAGPPDGAVAWWKSRMPTREAKKGQLAPNDVLLQLFGELEQVPDQADMRYVLALLLVRRRVLREEDVERDETNAELMVLYSPREETSYRVAVREPSGERIEQIQAELGRLLYADAT